MTFADLNQGKQDLWNLNTYKYILMLDMALEDPLKPAEKNAGLNKRPFVVQNSSCSKSPFVRQFSPKISCSEVLKGLVFEVCDDSSNFT